jgi:hypothetical protein
VATLQQPWPTDERQLSLEEAQERETRLTQLGFDTGGTDGRVGDKTQAAAGLAALVGMTPADGFPSDSSSNGPRRLDCGPLGGCGVAPIAAPLFPEGPPDADPC